jgi:hypothetical protein
VCISCSVTVLLSFQQCSEDLPCTKFCSRLLGCTREHQRYSAGGERHPFGRWISLGIVQTVHLPCLAGAALAITQSVPIVLEPLVPPPPPLAMPASPSSHCGNRSLSFLFSKVCPITPCLLPVFLLTPTFHPRMSLWQFLWPLH